MDENAASFDILDIALRLVAAVVVGVVIGINRDLTNKPIGMRTLGLRECRPQTAGSAAALRELGRLGRLVLGIEALHRIAGEALRRSEAHIA